MIAERSRVITGMGEQLADGARRALPAAMYSALRVRNGWPRTSRYSRSMSPPESGRGWRALRTPTCSGSKSSTLSVTPTLKGDSWGRSMKNCGSVDVERMMSSFFQQRRIGSARRLCQLRSIEKKSCENDVWKIASVSSMAKMHGPPRLEHVLLHVARAVLRAGVGGVPELLHRVRQVQLLGHPRREPAEEEIRVGLAVFAHELEVEQRDALAGVHAGLHRAHQAESSCPSGAAP